MYQDRVKCFENIENLGGKAWEYAVTLDCFKQNKY